MNYTGIIVSAYIQNPEGKILMVKLKKLGLWGLPGGKVDVGELPRNALMREIAEETGVKVEIEKLIGFREYFWESDNSYWVDLIYKTKIVSGNPEIKEPEKILEMEWKDKNNIPEGTTILEK
jgi:ADP-ribose pyrophosphatase YjhB (NUDIX family)